jgi:hypothetical protein|nr:MAG TPA: hypothetical protein [Caudoviricetes sp.]
MEQSVVSVTNRNVGYTCYSLQDSGVSRTFTPSETKKIPLEELKQLQFVEGGDYILRNCLLINDKEALAALDMEDVEPEYYYTEEDIKNLLETGSLDLLEDCLNFAPSGVIDIIKRVAVATELPDTRKRELISQKTGFNIDNAIRVNSVMNDDNSAKDDKPAAPVRKVAEPIIRKANITK